MIANFFNKSKPEKGFVIIVLLLIYFIITLIFTEKFIYSASNLLSKGSLFIVLLLFVFIVDFIIKKNRLTKDNYFGILIVVILIGIFHNVVVSPKLIYANLFLLLAYRKIFSLHSGVSIKMKLFDAAFWVGVALLIYPLSAVFLILIYTGIIIYQKIELKNLVIPIIGVLIPVFLYYVYCLYVLDFQAFKNNLSIQTSLEFNHYLQNTFTVILPFLGVFMLISIISVSPKIIMVSNKLKLSWQLVVFQFFLALVVVILVSEKSGAEFLFVLFPAAVIIANYLQKNKSRIVRNLILYMLLLLSVISFLL